MALASPMNAGGYGTPGKLEPNATVPQDLPAEELQSMLEELLAQYTSEAFQDQLKKMYAACAKQGVSLLSAMGPLVLQVQKPIFERYGLPPDARGVDLMKHAVQRRICEGASRVEELANQSRRALGIEQLPDRQRTAEEQLSKSADETAARFSDTDMLAGLRVKCQQMLDQSLAKGIMPPTSASFLRELLDCDRQECSLPSILCMVKMANLGTHVSQLRGEGLADTVTILDEMPSSEKFFSDFVLPSRPVVIRGAFTAKTFAPLEKLPDFSYLRQKCSHRRVLTKSLGFTDEAGRSQFMTDPELKLPLAAYLDAIEACEQKGTPVPYYLGKVPLKAELPELAAEIEEAETDPQREYGDCFGELLPEGVFTYFGCGRNSTSVHYDCHENLMLCLCGTKKLWLYPPGDARYVYPISKDRGMGLDFSRSALLPFQRFQDMSRENQARYPLLPKASPCEIMVHPGDLLYLPSCWWHCVEGSADRNIILNWWFGLHPEKKQLAFAAQA